MALEALTPSAHPDALEIARTENDLPDVDGLRHAVLDTLDGRNTPSIIGALK